uniref:General transcription factor 3C polypeptide 5-like n=1 Tax=Rhizophora mucronata TaxID=61149 RepID=A0A2P2LEA2_RHIMU
MGVIKEGEVSGFIPSFEGFAVHYPGYPSSMARAIETLGGEQAIAKARSSQLNKLELRFRPEDPYSHPAFGELHPSTSLLLKISKNKFSSCSKETRSPVQSDLSADIVARLPEAYHFEGMVDYQHVIAVHADAARRKKMDRLEMENERAGLMDLDQDDLMILVPPLFSLKDIPENLLLRPPAASLSKKKQADAVENHFEVTMEPSLAIDFNIKEVPKEIDWKAYITQGSELWEWQMAVSDLFQERPIWHKDSLNECLLDKGFKFNIQMLRRLLLAVAYYFSGGPFQRLWIRKGYDPRKDPESCIYQRIDFRVPLPIRSYCDSSTNKLKHRWEDLCKFRVFPNKCQTSLQLYELDDDYIKQEIRKPSKQTTCTYETGWFSQQTFDSLKLCVMVRFLRVYPKSGAEKLLKATSEDFEKSKRACIYKDAIKHNQEKPQKINKEIINDEGNENHGHVDDAERDDIESDDHEEELDAYEATDLGGEDSEFSLLSHSCILALLLTALLFGGSCISTSGK